MYRYVPGVRVFLQRPEYGPTIHTGKIDIKYDGSQLVFPRKFQSFLSSRCSQAFEALVVALMVKDSGKAGVVLNNQNQPVVFDQIVAVILNPVSYTHLTLPTNREVYISV